MKRGWGYGKQTMSLADKIRTGKIVKFESDTVKVYEYSLNDNSTYFKTITIKYIMKKDTKKKTIVFTGLYKAMNYDVSNLKNQKDIFDYVANVLFDKYFNYNRKLEDEYFDKIEAEQTESVQEIKETTQERAKKHLKGITRVEEMKEKELNQLLKDINPKTLQKVGTVEKFNILIADPKIGYGKYLIIKDTITNKIYNWTAGGEHGINRTVKFLLD